jgi:putative oxidoreductase
MAALAQTVSASAPRVLSVLRIITGLLFLEHGTMKLLGFPPSDMFADLQIASLLGAAGIIELVGGILMTIGLFTRPVAFILSGEMAIAYFKVHAPGSFFPAINEGELAVLYCFVFLYFACAGAGPWSADAARGKA